MVHMRNELAKLFCIFKLVLGKVMQVYCIIITIYFTHFMPNYLVQAQIANLCNHENNTSIDFQLGLGID